MAQVQFHQVGQAVQGVAVHVDDGAPRQQQPLHVHQTAPSKHLRFTAHHVINLVSRRQRYSRVQHQKNRRPKSALRLR